MYLLPFYSQFVASPKCQRILDEIIYYQWPHWQDVGRVTKFAWSIVQLLMVAISCFVYIPLRLLRKSPCFDEDDECWWNFREIYEHPFSKFINHSTWYMVFLVFVILNSMQQSFATRLMGLEWTGIYVTLFLFFDRWCLRCKEYLFFLFRYATKATYLNLHIGKPLIAWFSMSRYSPPTNLFTLVLYANQVPFCLQC